jgi:hypothetical protein
LSEDREVNEHLFNIEVIGGQHDNLTAAVGSLDQNYHYTFVDTQIPHDAG